MPTFQAIVRHGDFTFSVTLQEEDDAAARAKLLSACWGGVDRWLDAFEETEIVSIADVQADFSFVVLYDSELHHG